MTDVLAFIGCFTSRQRKARGHGITVYRVDLAARTWHRTDETTGLLNPSYLIVDPRKRFLYAAHGDADYLTTFAINRVRGSLDFINRVPTGGLNGVHHAIIPSGRQMLLANYASGTIARLPIDEEGLPSDYAELLPLPGTPGPHRNEQTGSHPHQVVFDPSGRFALVPDKGLDRVFVVSLDDSTGALHLVSDVATRPGAGPRHLVFHPELPIAFVLNELESTLATCAWDARSGRLTPLHMVSTLPDNYFGHSTAAAVVASPCGRFVYASNRGHNSVTQFAFDGAAGTVRLVDVVSSGGKTPRFMTLGPDRDDLFVANEGADSIVRFRIDSTDGALHRQPDSVSVASPSCLAFL